MDSFKIILATGLLIIFGTLLMACSEPADPLADFSDLKRAAEVRKDVELLLLAEREKNQVTVEVQLANPSHQPITSAQTWLSYDPQSLKGLKIDVTRSPFTLTAPFENTFDEKQGLVRLGRGSDHPILDPHVTVAHVRFEMLEPGTTMIHGYDYRSNLKGHSSANILLGQTPYNVLKKPASPLLIIQ